MRTRILAWFVLLMTIAVVGSMVVTANLLQSSSRQSIEEDIEREVAAFRSFSSRGINPETGERFDSAAVLLNQYLLSAVPGERKFLFSVIDGKPGTRTRGPAALRLDRDPDIVSAAASATEPRSGTSTTDAGLLAYAIIPIQDAEGAAGNALVIVEHMQPIMDETGRTIRSVGFVLMLALLVASFLSWLVTARLVAPMRQVLATAQEIDSGDLSRRIPLEDSYADDITQLAINFNRMLDRLEKAFATQREFLDDAAHELRTPLTVIRGNLELSGDRTGEGERQLLLGEVDRMNRLVDDLLLLARSEQPNFLSLERVDLTDLILNVAAKSQFLGDRRWGVPNAVSGSISADGQRLTQALMQLTSNAVNSTGDGQPIHIWSRISDDEECVELIVDDGGVGIPPEEMDQIFARFHGRRDGESTGLGLSIVRSIVVAHGGTVRAGDSALGGASFTISLPLGKLDATLDEMNDLEGESGHHTDGEDDLNAGNS
ncbi:ATP-binding protein [Actinomycetaceae bacterium L2_0104]